MNKNFIPNYLTLGNIFCGFISILTATHGYYVWATVFIILAMLADRYDGIVARKLGVVSEIGHDLDSLCDVVSFGVAPAVLVFEIFLANDKPTMTLTVIVALLCAIYVCCGAYRLARFNVTKMKNGYYQGVPITTCGTVLAIVSLFNLPSIVLLVLLVVSSYLMVSSIKIKKI
ncbi:CDP-diacylglycerol--serine O-phosphatidyltransferase [Gemella cuniculi]|uniref:CDP-diacylglycerol--serine O-phosphatidyltransferase n=1 Tax=Gemella cuniculi TaxID=150240 RepID=UPI000414DD0A|nr:CDP-diacylglycerol--serine O-phosphatidyltransferase [Gemella cuniculi]